MTEDTPVRRELSPVMRAMQRLLRDLHPGFRYRIVSLEGRDKEPTFALLRARTPTAKLEDVVYVAGCRGEHTAILLFGAIVRGVKLERMHSALTVTEIEGRLQEVEHAKNPS